MQVPKEFNMLIGLARVFKVSIRKDTFDYNRTTQTVTRILSDDSILATYCSNLNPNQERDLMSRMIEDDDDKAFLLEVCLPFTGDIFFKIIYYVQMVKTIRVFFFCFCRTQKMKCRAQMSRN